MSPYAHSAETVQPLSTDISSHAFASSVSSESLRTKEMQKSRSAFTGTVLGKPARDSGAVVKGDNVAFLRSQARRIAAKEGAERTGMSPKGFQKLQQGENTISFDKLIEWCRNDPMFAAAFAEHVGLVLPGEAEFSGALTQAFNAYQRKQGRE
jgi:hypothetical protein